jgi:TonB-linked SusC/RagA family outer membrane protein
MPSRTPQTRALPPRPTAQPLPRAPWARAALGRAVARAAMTGAAAPFAASLTLAAALAAPAAAHAQAQVGVVTGRVVDEGSGQPVPQVQVSVVGQTSGAVTTATGTFTVRGVSAGTVQLRFLRIGYAEVRRTVTVRAGETARVDATMQRRALELAPVVATATGLQNRGEVPNAIANINAAQVVQNTQINSVGDLLVGKAAGVQILQGSQVGAGQRIRIRGTASLNLNNEPVVFVDGVRIDSRANAQIIGVGGSAAGRLNDLNPDDIENIDVIRGPSGSATYGTDAANGVIVITTKRGRAGRSQWNFYTEQGAANDPTKYPDAYTAFGRTSTGAASDCTIVTISSKACTVDSLRTYNLYEDPRATPLRNGYRRQYGANISGGTQAATYFVGLDAEGQDGVYTIPTFERERLGRAGTPIQGKWLNPNNYERQSLRSNVDIRPSDQFRLPVSAYYVNSNTRFPQDANNTTGVGSNALGGPGTPFRTTATGDTLYGYRLFTPGDIFQEVVQSDLQRFIGSVNPTYTPTSWLTVRGNAGADFASQTDDDTCLRGNCVNNGQTRLGFRTTTRSRNFQYTVDGSASASFSPFSWLTTRTTAGAQYVESRFDRNGAFGNQLPPGGQTVTQASVQTGDEATTIAKTAGVFVEQTLGFRGTIDLVGSVRGDQNSAFGRNFGTAYYPRGGATWRLSEEGWFPKGRVSNLRLRASYGQAGIRPGTTAALPFFGALTLRANSQEVPGIAFQTLGNTSLRPETVGEFEGGVDLGLFNGRLSAEASYYSKVSRDALIERVLPPSLGNGATSRFENLGKVKNAGVEYLVRAQPLALPNLSVDLTLNGSRNANKFVTLGAGIPPIIGTNTRQTPGYPLNGLWARNYTYNDANNDRLITPGEIQQDTAFTFLGYSQPRTEITFQTGVDVFRYVRLSGLLDYKGDYRIINTTQRFRCTNRNNAQERVDVNAPLDRQARCAAALQAGALQNFGGYLEDGSFLRLRELSVTLRAPDALTRRFIRGRTASLTLAGRNLAVWTDFTGLDPETSVGQGDLQDEFQGAPPLRLLTARINLGF